MSKEDKSTNRDISSLLMGEIITNIKKTEMLTAAALIGGNRDQDEMGKVEQDSSVLLNILANGYYFDNTHTPLCYQQKN